MVVGMEARRAALEQMLAQMRGEYAARLSERLARIETLWREVAAGDTTRGEELVRAAHSIAGAAATFGLPEVGRAALELELALRAAHAAGSAESNDVGASHVAKSVARLFDVSRAAISGARERA